ncbi:MAG: N-6 DNA methylase [Thermoflexales bacterium]
MTAAAQLALAAHPHNNAQLFSDYFLDTTLPRSNAWKMLAGDPAVEASKAEIAALLARFVPSANEAQTERELVRPVLELLGHTFEVQPALTTPDGTKRPDYVLYADSAARDAQKNRVLTDALPGAEALAVGDAKYWDRPLDTTLRTGSDPFNNKNPSYQIAFYIQHSGVTWGVLTNGRHWRLYHKNSAHKLDRYYEVDLPALARGADVEAFLYFYAFFHRSAFNPGPLALDELLGQSARYARGVSETLKTQVYEALRHLAQGFLDHPANALSTDAASLKAIYDNSLIALYRLLFILYAEARELLPVRESADYRDEYSLMAIKEEVRKNLVAGRHLLTGTKRMWHKLTELFDIINEGSPPLKVGTFNGGLFDPRRHPFLGQYAVGDAHLQLAIDRLTRVEGDFIDYRDLAERHLGTIYEGLLEYHLVLLAEPGPDGWRVDLVNDKGERKSSGSYYTPDFIVKTIVDAAVGPALREATARASTDEARVRAVLTLNVLDPAMGSGHFLVEVVEYVARYLVDLGIAPVGNGKSSGEGDMAYWKRRVAQSVIYGVDLNPLAVELAKLSLWLVTVAKDRPLSFLDHHLRAGNSLVGEQLEAVRAFAQTKPQKRKRLEPIAGPQESLFNEEELRRSMSLAVDSMWIIEDNPALTVEDVKEQERVYSDLRATLTAKYKRLADLMTANHFGLDVPEALRKPLADRATAGTGMAIRQLDDILTQADAIAAGGRFFHWQIEFPEVFFDREGQSLGEDAGFSAVVGNPPYVRQEELGPFKPFFQSHYPDVYKGTADLFVYFFGQGLNLLKTGGRLGYIASNSWLRANYAAPLRSYLRNKVSVETLIDLGDNRVFEDAPDLVPAIPIVRKAAPDAAQTAQVAVFTRGEGLDNFERRLTAKFAPVSIHDQNDEGWQLGVSDGRTLFAKVMQRGAPLGEVFSQQLYRGVVTGLNEAFIVDGLVRDQLCAQDAGSSSKLRKLVRGEDLRPWYCEDEDRWLIFMRRGEDIDAFPAIKAHLSQFRTALEPKPADWNDAQEWTGRKTGAYKWYEIQDPVEYHAEFDKPKILWPDISKYPRFSWDSSGLLTNNTGYMLRVDDPFILAVLQSRCIWHCMSQLCTPQGERDGTIRYRLQTQFIERLPIPSATAEDRAVLGDLAMRITEQAKARYALHRDTRARILTDLSAPGGGGKLNNALSAWWTLGFAAFRAEVKKAMRADIPVRDRAGWETYLGEQRARHDALTGDIIRLETELNAHVYRLFDLTAAEIALIEASTKYKYGAV